MSDILMSFLYYALGYFYSIVVGHWLILNFSKNAWEALGEIPKGEKEIPYRWTSSLSGILDRVIYTSSLLIPAKEFIAVWLAIKVAVQWKRWDDEKDLGKARASFHIFVIGTGLSLLYGVVGALIVEWLSSQEYMPAIVVPVLLVVLSLYFINVAKTKVVSKDKKK